MGGPDWAKKEDQTAYSTITQKAKLKISLDHVHGIDRPFDEVLSSCGPATQRAKFKISLDHVHGIDRPFSLLVKY
ncbi:hypothetical protein PanWU01x14_227620 [Parasponia andersonii]|uniref:Uncharacterized protein n=1 Tax=Parasponia andersonii TaxID=3476 RepID=A0A2P5BM27_PARAD|nr:hypothetical protein PanWU01x14_227620 [Parasponia andersonii]